MQAVRQIARRTELLPIICRLYFLQLARRMEILPFCRQAVLQIAGTVDGEKNCNDFRRELHQPGQSSSPEACNRTCNSSRNRGRTHANNNHAQMDHKSCLVASFCMILMLGPLGAILQEGPEALGGPGLDSPGAWSTSLSHRPGLEEVWRPGLEEAGSGGFHI